MIDGVSLRDSNAFQRIAGGKSSVSDTRHAFRNRDTRKAAAIVEGLCSYARHALRDRDARKAGAAGKCTPSNTRHTVRDRNARKVSAAVKGIVSYARHTGFDNHAYNPRPLIIPRDAFSARIIAHIPRAGDRENTVVGKRPYEIIAARAGSHGICRQQGRLILRKFILRWFIRRLSGGFYGRLCRRLGSRLDGRFCRGFRGRLCRGFGGRFRRRVFRRVGLRIAVGYSLRLLLVADRPRRDGKLRGQHDRKKHSKQFLHIPYSPFYVRIYFTLTLHYTLLLEKCKKSGGFFAGFQTGL